MSPIVKYSKERILEVGLKIIEERGIEEISARNIAKELGSSICPVFSYFENMGVLKQELLNAMLEIYNNYVKEGMKFHERAFKGAGLAYIKFAKENKNYFKALFMGKTNMDIESLLCLNSQNDYITSVICKNTGLDEKTAIKLHKYNWVFVHGIAVMVASDYCKFEDEEISRMLSEEYFALLSRFKDGE